MPTASYNHHYPVHISGHPPYGLPSPVRPVQPPPQPQTDLPEPLEPQPGLSAAARQRSTREPQVPNTASLGLSPVRTRSPPHTLAPKTDRQPGAAHIRSSPRTSGSCSSYTAPPYEGGQQPELPCPSRTLEWALPSSMHSPVQIVQPASVGWVEAAERTAGSTNIHPTTYTNSPAASSPDDGRTTQPVTNTNPPQLACRRPSRRRTHNPAYNQHQPTPVGLPLALPTTDIQPNL